MIFDFNYVANYVYSSAPHVMWQSADAGFLYDEAVVNRDKIKGTNGVIHMYLIWSIYGLDFGSLAFYISTATNIMVT